MVHGGRGSAIDHVLSRGIMHIPSHHFQCGMSEYLLQPEDITAFMVEEVGGIGMAAEVSV